MENRFYFLKKWLIPMDGWGVLIALFTVSFVMAKANFESYQERNLFLLSWLIFLSVVAVGSILMHGGFRMLFGLNIEHKDAFFINSFILNGHVDKNVSGENLKALAYQIKIADRNGPTRVFFYSAFVVLMSALVMAANGTSFSNLATILIGGFLGAFVFTISALFSTGSFWGNLLRECKEALREKGITAEEKLPLITLKNGFYYFAIMVIWMMIIILSFIPNPDPYLLILIFTGLVLVIIVIKIIFSSIFSVFQEIRDFSNKLPEGKEIEYLTGSYYREVFDLSRDLTRSAEEMHEAKKRDIESREELEKFYKLTIGRELRMAELKEKMKKLEEKNN